MFDTSEDAFPSTRSCSLLRTGCKYLKKRFCVYALSIIVLPLAYAAFVRLWKNGVPIQQTSRQEKEPQFRRDPNPQEDTPPHGRLPPADFGGVLQITPTKSGQGDASIRRELSLSLMKRAGFDHARSHCYRHDSDIEQDIHTLKRYGKKLEKPEGVLMEGAIQSLVLAFRQNCNPSSITNRMLKRPLEQHYKQLAQLEPSVDKGTLLMMLVWLYQRSADSKALLTHVLELLEKTSPEKEAFEFKSFIWKARRQQNRWMYDIKITCPHRGFTKAKLDDRDSHQPYERECHGGGQVLFRVTKRPFLHLRVDNSRYGVIFNQRLFCGKSFVLHFDLASQEPDSRYCPYGTQAIRGACVTRRSKQLTLRQAHQYCRSLPDPKGQCREGFFVAQFKHISKSFNGNAWLSENANDNLFQQGRIVRVDSPSMKAETFCACSPNKKEF